MFSNDNNVESIAQLIETFKHYIGLQSEYVKLDVIEKVVRLLTAIAVLLGICLLMVFATIAFSFAAVYGLEPYTGLPVAFCFLGGFYLLLLWFFFLFRHRLVERPLVKFLASLLLSK